jgi:energy-coupling factor transport system substrate-specific component
LKFKLSSLIINIAALLLGMASLLAPLIIPWGNGPGNVNTTMPLMISLIIIFCLIIIFLDIQYSSLDTKMIAFLGVVIAINAGLRFLENAIPGPAGFSPTFLMIILVGYIFGGQYGFLTGALTMFASALITGGVGPWLPGQMITAGWVGQSAALLKWGKQKSTGKIVFNEIFLLAVHGGIWGMLYGMIINLWYLPFLTGLQDQILSSSASLVDNLNRYIAYYLATSLVWDFTRAIGNILLILILAKPILRIFRRFQIRFSFSYQENSNA